MIRNVSRQVYPGEQFVLDAEGTRWSVYVRTAEESYAVKLGSYDLTTGAWTVPADIDVSLRNAAHAIAADANGNPQFSESALEMLREAAVTSRSAQVIFYSEAGAAQHVITLDFGDFGATSLDDSIAKDREYLALLEKTRTDATDTQGISVLELPDGRKETYRSIVALDGQIAAVRDRIARLLVVQSGGRFPGAYIN